ncbi:MULTISPECIES: hypothetical protein [unclassified Dysgonomonas]|uniref:hypothetical protein n=1 Tax=unclassified Dysgonomonas TaxID=2630389 RepID=UPI0006831759|nr:MULTISPECIES: hypothetical protein [unclassified Dysgonomonas]MBD8347446.1 hypothetical protein [Dysgonomonas sp. HGC4]MBF0577095.1 hypothetical protein [Dysgonomonas sp. GY617]
MQYKNILLLALLSIFSYFPLSAQEHSHRGDFDIEAFKQKRAEFIIEKVNLTDAEAKAFIPLTNELMDKRFELNRAIRKESRELRKKSNKTNADYERLLEASSSVKIKEAQLEQEYLQKFKKVLSAEKIYRYKQAETQYMKELVGNRSDKERSKRK